MRLKSLFRFLYRKTSKKPHKQSPEDLFPTVVCMIVAILLVLGAVGVALGIHAFIPLAATEFTLILSTLLGAIFWTFWRLRYSRLKDDPHLPRDKGNHEDS